MHDFLLVVSASFLGTLSALMAYGLLFAERRPLIKPAGAADRAPQSRMLAIAAGVIFAAVAAFLMVLVSNGSMAPALAAIAIVLTVLTLAYFVRALR